MPKQIMVLSSHLGNLLRTDNEMTSKMRAHSAIYFLYSMINMLIICWEMLAMAFSS